MLNKENSEQLLITEELNAFQFRDKVGEILQAYQCKTIDHFVFDIECKGLNIFEKDCELIGFSIADPINKIGYFIGLTHPDLYVPENEKKLILSCLFKLLYNIPVVGHNIIFDLNYMTFQYSLDMNKVVILDDTLFLAYYLFGTKRDTGISLSLKNIFRHFFNIDLVWEEELSKALESNKRIKDRHFFNVPYATISKYGAYDSIVTYYLRLGILEKLKNRNMTAYNFLIKSIHVFVELETTGLAIDWEFREYLLKCYNEKIVKFEEKVQSMDVITKWREDTFGNFNINSTKMVGEILYGRNYYSCPVLNTTDKGNASTNEEALFALVKAKTGVPDEAKGFINELLENRNCVKMVTTYLEPLTERKITDGLYSPDYNLIGAATGRLCFVGETKISLLEGTEKRLDELEKDTEFYVYSCEENGKVVPTKAKSLGVTKHVTQLIEVTLDNNLTERCTPEHKWMLRDGTYKEAKDLVEGDSLMPLYRRDQEGEGRNSRGYTQILDNFDDVWKSIHTLVNSKYNRTQQEEVQERIKEKIDRFLITHHKDFNSRNNCPENLEWMGENEHWIYHQEIIKLNWRNPEFKSKFSESMSKLFKTPKYNKFFVEHNRRQLLKRWQSKDYIKLMSDKMSKRWESEEFRQLVSRTMRNTITKLWKDPKFQEIQRQKLKDLWEDPEYRKKMAKVNSETSLKLWQDPNHREMMSEISRKHIYEQMKDPDFCEKRNAAARITLAKSKQNPEWMENNKRALRRGGFNRAKIVIGWLQENKLELNKENYYSCPRVKKGYPSYEKVLTYIEQGEVIYKKNHKVIKVNKVILNEPVPVYDITILDGPNNFALSSGVIVHNSSYFHTLPTGNDIKRMIVSRFKNDGGIVIISDFSQLEVRVCGAVSGDPNMKEAYIKGYDVHAYIASIMFNKKPELITKSERKNAKAVVFGILYGKGVWSLADELDISKEEAQKLVDYFFIGFPNVKKWIDYQHNFLKVNKYVTTPFGRTRYLRDVDSKEFRKINEALRAAQNTPIQSLASDLAFSAALRIYYDLKDSNMKSKFIGSVHDSILVDAHPEEVQKVLEIMRFNMNDYINQNYEFLNGLPIASDFEVGISWGGACGLGTFNEKVWNMSGYREDAEQLVERLKMSNSITSSNLLEVESNEDKMIKFVDPGKKVKFKIVW